MQSSSDRKSRPTPTHHDREPFVLLTLTILAAPLLWVLHFGGVYALEEFLCKPVVAAWLPIPAAIIFATLICGGICAWLAIAGPARLQRGEPPLESRSFLGRVQRLLALLALVAILWGGSGALFFDPCSLAY